MLNLFFGGRTKLKSLFKKVGKASLYESVEVDLRLVLILEKTFKLTAFIPAHRNLLFFKVFTKLRLFHKLVERVWCFGRQLNLLHIRQLQAILSFLHVCSWL